MSFPSPGIFWTQGLNKCIMIYFHLYNMMQSFFTAPKSTSIHFSLQLRSWKPLILFFFNFCNIFFHFWCLYLYFYWSLIVLQCCANFWLYNKVYQLYINIYPLPLEPPSFPLPNLTHPRSSQSTELSSRCYLATFHYLFYT